MILTTTTWHQRKAEAVLGGTDKPEIHSATGSNSRRACDDLPGGSAARSLRNTEAVALVEIVARMDDEHPICDTGLGL
jgi:hypothetical protein